MLLLYSLHNGHSSRLADDTLRLGTGDDMEIGVYTSRTQIGSSPPGMSPARSFSRAGTHLTRVCVCLIIFCAASFGQVRLVDPRNMSLAFQLHRRRIKRLPRRKTSSRWPQMYGYGSGVRGNRSRRSIRGFLQPLLAHVPQLARTRS